MSTPDPAPLIREGSRVFATIAAAALLVGGVAGMARGSGNQAHPAHAAQAAATTAAAAPEMAAADGRADGHAHRGARHGHSAAGAAVAAGGHDHDHGATGEAVTAAAAPSAAGHDGHADHADHGDHTAATPAGGAAPTPMPEAAHGDHGDHGNHAAPAGDGGHGTHGPAADGDHDHHATSCADDHPVTTALVTEVQGELATTYKDIASLIALGYHPYFDSLVPGGYPPGGEGISHWINPNYIDDGVVLDPQRPETILLDDWNWPIGMMFINDPGIPPKPVYVNDDGTSCSPWHPHTDYPARFGWYYYRAMYDRELEGEVPEQTPEMMHVWAVPNPKGVYAAHDYPKREVRKGAPGPLPSYFSDAEIPPA